jgi:hypothetical protein
MKKDFKFLEITAASSGRQKIIDEMLSSAKEVEKSWKIAREGGDLVEVEEQNTKLSSSNAVIIQAIMLDCGKVFGEIAEYLEDSLIRLDEGRSINAIQTEESRKKRVEFSIYPCEPIYYVFENMSKITKDFCQYSNLLGNAIKNLLSGSMENQCEKVQEAESACKEFISFVNMEKIFKVSLYDTMTPYPEAMSSGDAVIFARKLSEALRVFIQDGLSLCEKFKIFSKRFSASENMPAFHDMSMECRKLFFVLCRAIRSMTPALLTMSRNFVKAMHMANENFWYIKTTVETTI